MSPPTYPLVVFIADITCGTNVPTAKYGITRHVKNTLATAVQRRQAGEKSSLHLAACADDSGTGATVGGATPGPNFSLTMSAASSSLPLSVSHRGVSGTVALIG